MKLFSTYKKEMTIASRGFYFYIELFVAVVVLIILLVAVEEHPDGKGVEYLYNDIPEQTLDYLYEKKINEGAIAMMEDTEIVIKPSTFTIVNKETGEEQFFSMTKEKVVMATTYQKLDEDTGKVRGIAYVLDNEEDMIRMSYNTGDIGAKTTMAETGQFSYQYYLQGYETQRFEDVLYLLHTFSDDQIDQVKDQLNIRAIGRSEHLNSREAVVPVYVAFAGALMGFFIIMSYIFLDKSQGVIKAFAVTPSSIWRYLLSKTFVILTTVVISSSLVVLPVMKFKPNYLLFYIFLLASSFAFSCLGLLVASFFDSISKAFGVLYLIMIALMLPAFSYYISSFDPLWIRFFPTYPLLEGFKGIMEGQADVGYVLIYAFGFVVGGFILLGLANKKFKQSLTL